MGRSRTTRHPLVHLAIASLLVVACAASLSEVAAEPVFQPHPEATEIHRTERKGGGGGFPTTRVDVTYALPRSLEEMHDWYRGELEDAYDLIPERSDGEARSFVSGRNPDTDSHVSVTFWELADLTHSDIPQEAIDAAPPETRLFVEVKAEKD